MTGKSNELKRPARDKIVSRTGAVCLLGLGGFLLWATLAPLEEGVTAHGKVIIDDDRKVVQHLEGGIVSEIRVREGDRVEAGDVLLILKDTVSLAGRDQAIQEYAASLASVARLKALETGAGEPDFDGLDTLELGQSERADIKERELSLFRQQLDAFEADVAVLAARRDAAVDTQKQRETQAGITRRAAEASRSELNAVRALFAQQLAKSTQVSAAERQFATLEAEVSRLESEQQAAAAAERDLEAQISQAKARFARTIAADLQETRGALLSVEERLGAAQDVLDRAVITAPVSGEVLNLKTATIGGVVRPGETLMEIVPDVRDITASIRIRPMDRASVFEGQLVRTQISAYRGWQVPRIEGRVIGVSADLKEDPATGLLYYEARVRVPHDRGTGAENIEIIPGMPVNAFIYSGRSRTMADYLLAPLRESLFRGLRAS